MNFERQRIYSSEFPQHYQKARPDLSRPMRQAIRPMTLGNMRENGVNTLAVPLRR